MYRPLTTTIKEAVKTMDTDNLVEVRTNYENTSSNRKDVQPFFPEMLKIFC